MVYWPNVLAQRRRASLYATLRGEASYPLVAHLIKFLPESGGLSWNAVLPITSQHDRCSALCSQRFPSFGTTQLLFNMSSFFSNGRFESFQIKVLNVIQEDLGQLLLERACSIQANVIIEFGTTVYAYGIP